MCAPAGGPHSCVGLLSRAEGKGRVDPLAGVFQAIVKRVDLNTKANENDDQERNG